MDRDNRHETEQRGNLKDVQTLCPDARQPFNQKTIGSLIRQPINRRANTKGRNRGYDRCNEKRESQRLEKGF